LCGFLIVVTVSLPVAVLIVTVSFSVWPACS
jgi:hypothetical protein